MAYDMAETAQTIRKDRPWDIPYNVSRLLENILIPLTVIGGITILIGVVLNGLGYNDKLYRYCMTMEGTQAGAHVFSDACYDYLSKK